MKVRVGVADSDAIGPSRLLFGIVAVVLLLAPSVPPHSAMIASVGSYLAVNMFVSWLGSMPSFNVTHDDASQEKSRVAETSGDDPRGGSDDSDGTPVELIHEKYVSGELNEEEFEELLGDYMEERVDADDTDEVAVDSSYLRE